MEDIMKKITSVLLISTMVFCSNAVAFADTMPQETVQTAITYNNSENIVELSSSTLYAAAPKYKEGVDDVSISKKGVKVYLSKTTANAALTGAFGAAGIWIPEATAAKLLATLAIGATVKPVFKGGIWFFCSWSDLGMTYVTSLGRNFTIPSDAITSAGYQ